MKKMKIAAAVMAAAVGCSGTVLPCAVSAAPPEASDNVLMVCDFENGAELPVTSSGGASAEVTESPIGTSYRKMGSNATGANTEENIAAGLEGYAALLKADKDNKVLKLTGTAAGDSNTVTLYEGVLPEDFALNYSVIGSPSFAAFTISAEQNGNSYNLIRCDQWTSIYLTDSTSRYAMTAVNMWSPMTLIFSDFASDNTALTVYLNGRLNFDPYTGNPAVNPPASYDKAYKELGAYYSGLDLSKDVKITLTQTGAVDSVYFDNFRIYKYENSISNEAGNDFEADTVKMAPMQNGIRTGGQVNSQWFHTSTEATVQQKYGLAAYTMNVESDPFDETNKVLKNMRGDGSNQWSYDSAARFTVNKPKERLEISFKALTNGSYSIAADIADGTFRDVFFSNKDTTPADRMFTFDNNNKIVASGTTTASTKDTVNWELDKWNDVKIVYDVENNTASLTINGVELDDITPHANSIIPSIMSSEEETVTVALFRPTDTTEAYIMLDDISIKSDGGNTDEPEPEPGVTVTERMDAVNAEDDLHAGYFWNVTVPTLEGRDSIKGTFTSEKGKMEREFDITTINGEGGAVFSVLLLDAPEDVTAVFE